MAGDYRDKVSVEENYSGVEAVMVEG